MSRLPRIVYDRELPRMSVAALGPIVQQARELGDAVASGILERAADELVLAARSVATQLEMRGDEFAFVLAGGVFPVVPWLAYEVTRRLVEVAPRSQVRLLDQEPAVGAVCLALAEARGGLRLPRYRMPVTIKPFPTAHAAARALALARRIARALAANPRLVLGLPTGRTPVPLYRELVALHQAGRADFSRATTFNLDEFAGVAGSDPHSYRAFMQRYLFSRINLSPRRINFLNGAAHDAAAECARYERAIARAGGIDLLILGLGANGHIGFNEPADALVAATHRTALSYAPATQRRRTSALVRRQISAACPRSCRGMRYRWEWRRSSTRGASSSSPPAARRRGASIG